MTTCRIALANVRFPVHPELSIAQAVDAIAQTKAAGAMIVCFPECFVPGYRGLGRSVAAPDAGFLERAWNSIADAARDNSVAVVLGTERVMEGNIVPTALVIGANGERMGFQDKVQLDPSEDDIYTPGTGRQLFHAGPLTFGVVICHEGWRYPETVRWAARRGAHVVFHPHFQPAEDGMFRPTTYGDPRNTFHENAVLCRAAENTCYFASVNYAEVDAPIASAVARPDGELLCYHPYGAEGLLVADIDTALATGKLAKRYKWTD
jgi:predicted amidohydrolase